MDLAVGKPTRRYSAGEAALVKQASMYGRPVVPVVNRPPEPELTQTVRDDQFAGEE